jgi:hypothetical protein
MVIRSTSVEFLQHILIYCPPLKHSPHTSINWRSISMGKRSFAQTHTPNYNTNLFAGSGFQCTSTYRAHNIGLNRMPPVACYPYQTFYLLSTPKCLINKNINAKEHDLLNMHHIWTWNNFHIFKLRSCIPLLVQILITDSLRIIVHVPVGEVKRARGERPM